MSSMENPSTRPRSRKRTRPRPPPWIPRTTSMPAPTTVVRWSEPWSNARSEARPPSPSFLQVSHVSAVPGQRQERRGRGRTAADAGGLPASPSAADRNPCRLRARRVRRLHRDRRRRGGALVPDARRAGRGRRDRDRGRSVQRRRSYAAAEVVSQASRPAMRVLHAGHDHDGACAVERGAGLRRRTRARGSFGQPLPLHRLHFHRRSGTRRARGLWPQRRSWRSCARAQMRTVNSLIGSAIERLEDLRFLRGRGQYVDDLARKDMLHAAFLRSSVAHGRIRSIDVSAARALPGVHDVLTAKDIGNRVPRVPMRLQPLPDFEPFGQPVIAETKVRYVGEVLAFVLADTAGIAEDALGLIDIDIEPLPAVADRHASAQDASLLFEDTGTNLAIKFHAVLGDTAAAFKDAPYVRRESFRTQRHMALPMEPRGLLAEWDAARGHLTVSGGAKVLFFNRRILAKEMGLPESAIEIVENDVGGGFGARGEFYPEDFLIPFAARHTGRPVKWTEDRRENLMCLNHAREAECDVEIACTREGTILGLRGHAYVDVGAYMRTNGAVGARNIAQFMSGPYRIANIDIDVALQLTNKTPVGTYRGPGRFETDFFRERFLDMVAQDLGLDRVEFRRRNLVSRQEMPYSIATITPFESEDAFDSGDYQITLDRCLDEIGWTEKSKLAGQLIDGRYHGLAIGCFIEGGAAGPKETARMVLEPDGLYSVYVGSSAIGQGLETAFAQIAADALEVPMNGIRGVFHGTTSFVSDGYGAYHSRSVVMGGSAMLAAAANLRDAIRAQAARRF